MILFFLLQEIIITSFKLATQLLDFFFFFYDTSDLMYCIMKTKHVIIFIDRTLLNGIKNSDFQSSNLLPIRDLLIILHYNHCFEITLYGPINISLIL